MTYSSREVLATAGEVLIENNLKADCCIAPQEHPYTPLINTSVTETHTHTHISEMLKVILKYELACLLSSVFSAGSLVVRKNLRTWKVAREGETESVVLHFQPKTLSVACLASEFASFVRWSHD